MTIVTTILLAGLRWFWLSAKRWLINYEQKGEDTRVADKAEILAAVSSVKSEMGELSQTVAAHQIEDTVMFTQLRERTAWLEGNANRPLGSTKGELLQ